MGTSSHPAEPGRKIGLFFLVALIAVLYRVSTENYLLFHSTVEIFGVIIASCVFMIAWNARRFHDNDYFLFIGMAYVFIAGLDLLHTLLYENMGVLPENGADPATQLWIAARLLQSLSLLIAPLFVTRRLPVRAALATFAALVSFTLAAIFPLKIFPDCYVKGIGLTPFKIVSEYAVCFILLASIFVLNRKRNAFDRRVLNLLILSIGANIASELAFTLYLHTNDLMNMVGHLFKIISFYLFYKAIIETALMKPYDLLFRNLKRSEEALRASESRYMALSITDGLTNLYNAREFQSRSESELERADRYGRPLSLLLLDVDNFKTYNDTYGHPEGDQVLIRLGEIIRSCLRASDSAYRYGGEEFTIILPETPAESALQVAERIRQEFAREPFAPFEGEEVHMTVSVGMAAYRPGEGLKSFVKRADRNMYRAKEMGKNRVFADGGVAADSAA